MKNGEECVVFLGEMTNRAKMMKVNGVVYWVSQLKALMTFKSSLQFKYRE